ncbi:MAG: right-handed parallel beta-helix repeat-containing protein [Promethearchaeota archaeon]
MREKKRVPVHQILTLLALLFPVSLHFSQTRGRSDSDGLVPDPRGADPPIFIDGNSDLSGYPGDGLTWETAYRLEDFSIDVAGGSFGIFVNNTDSYLIIENCSVFNSGGRVEGQAGILLNNCTNVRVLNCTVQYVENGILSNASTSINVSNTVATDNGAGVRSDSTNSSTYSGNILLRNSDFGLALENCVDDVVEYNNASNNYFAGMHVESCANSSFSGNNCTNNTATGFRQYYSTSIEHQGNTIEDNWCGMDIYASLNTSLAFSSLENLQNNIQISFGVNDSVFNNTITGGQAGVELQDCLTENLVNNTLARSPIKLIGNFNSTVSHDIKGNNLNGKPVYYFTNSSDVSNENVTGFGEIILVNITDSFLHGLSFKNSSTFELHHSTNVTLWNSSFQGNSGHIYVANSNNCTLENLSLVDASLVAVHLENDVNISFTNVTLSGGFFGVWVENCSLTSFRGSNFSDFAYYNLNIDSESDNNTIEWCRFYSSQTLATDSGQFNTWDFNYWDDYEQGHPSAVNNLLYWNVPYSVKGDAKSTDQHPLVPIGTENVPPLVNGTGVTLNITAGERHAVTFVVYDRTLDASSYSVFLNGTRVASGEWTNGSEVEWTVQSPVETTFTLELEIDDGLSEENVTVSVEVRVRALGPDANGGGSGETLVLTVIVLSLGGASLSIFFVLKRLKVKKSRLLPGSLVSGPPSAS